MAYLLTLGKTWIPHRCLNKRHQHWNQTVALRAEQANPERRLERRIRLERRSPALVVRSTIHSDGLSATPGAPQRGAPGLLASKNPSAPSPVQPPVRAQRVSIYHTQALPDPDGCFQVMACRYCRIWFCRVFRREGSRTVGAGVHDAAAQQDHDGVEQAGGGGRRRVHQSRRACDL